MQDTFVRMHYPLKADAALIRLDRRVEYDGKQHYSCITDMLTPANRNPQCRELQKYLRLKDFDHPTGLYFQDGRQERHTTCHPFKPGDYGWCGTCSKALCPLSNDIFSFHYSNKRYFIYVNKYLDSSHQSRGRRILSKILTHA